CQCARAGRSFPTKTAGVAVVTAMGSTAFSVTDRDRQSGASVVVEDDGRVCYAYFLSAARDVLGDVWLYNRCQAPAEREWTDRARALFANPSVFVRRAPGFELPESSLDIGFLWPRNEGGEACASILSRGLVIGKLPAGANPGWARAAAKGGPLARV